MYKRTDQSTIRTSLYSCSYFLCLSFAVVRTYMCVCIQLEMISMKFSLSLSLMCSCLFISILEIKDTIISSLWKSSRWWYSLDVEQYMIEEWNVKECMMRSMKWMNQMTNRRLSMNNSKKKHVRTLLLRHAFFSDSRGIWTSILQSTETGDI